ncbi:Uma2 family endonuclease [Pseudanabaena minima]|uniref:Uma2 family endonuclease n=1 Tax=Pseudanabaena minima TaxID=890415 RepID=UPI003DA85CAD
MIATVPISSRSDISHSPWNISWELLPDDYVLPDDPVENLIQPALAAFLNEILGLHGFITADAIATTDFGICANVNGKTVVKAPDWVWIPHVEPLADKHIRRSYTPYKEGDLPAIVMEFLSASDCGEYSMNPNYPYGKWWFYERILQIPIYVIFHPESGDLEVYFLKDGRYERSAVPENGLYWLDALGLHLSVWEGSRFNSHAFWLRWWNREGELLPCGNELVEQERQRVEQERQRNERLIVQLRSLGVEPDP